jgi:hypothetical protein
MKAERALFESLYVLDECAVFFVIVCISPAGTCSILGLGI